MTHSTHPDRKLIALVVFGDDHNDLGVVVADASGGMSALWPDGGADAVYRDARGWLWDEYGDTSYKPTQSQLRRTRYIEHRKGTRLRIVSRRASWMRVVLRQHDATETAT